MSVAIASTRARTVLALFGAFMCCSVQPCLANGTVDPPPGPVQGTMKTLDEVEPRTPINSQNTPGDANATFVISQPGVYYLTGDLLGEIGKNGIRVDGEDVEIVLNGFSICGPLGGGGLSGIEFTPNVEGSCNVAGGRIKGWDDNGISVVDSVERPSVFVEDVELRENTNGASVGASSHVEFTNVRAIGNAANGVVSSGANTVNIFDGDFRENGKGISIGSQTKYDIVDTVVSDSVSEGIFNAGGRGSLVNVKVLDSGADGVLDQAPGTVLDNVFAAGNTGNGLTLGDGATVKGCGSKDNMGSGLVAGNGLTVSDFFAYDNVSSGVQAGNKATIRKVNSSRNGGDGIRGGNDVVISDARVSANQNIGITALNDVFVLDTFVDFSGDEGGLFEFDADISGSAFFGNSSDGLKVGMNSTVRDTNASNNGGSGILGFNQGISQPVTINNSTANANTINGVSVGNGSKVEGVTANDNLTSGISVGAFSQIANTITNGNALNGIFANGGNVTITDSQASLNQTGVTIGVFGVITGGAFTTNEIGIKVEDDADCVRIEGVNLSQNQQGAGTGIVFGLNANGAVVRRNTFSANTRGVDFPNLLGTTGGNYVIANFFSGNTFNVTDSVFDPNKVADFECDPDLVGVNTNLSD